MPIEPDRPIEKALRSSAAKRRKEDEASWDLPAHTRQLLQAEVARKYRSNENAAKRFIWWPKIAWTAAVSAVLMIAFWEFLPHKKQLPAERLARNEPARVLAPATLSPEAEVINETSTSEHMLSVTGPITAHADSDRANEPVDKLSPATPDEPAGVSNRAFSANREAGRALAPVAPTAAQAETFPESNAKLGDSNADLVPIEKEKSVSGPLQHFAATPLPAGAVSSLVKDSPGPAVLTTFDAQQNGNELRIVDADGSVYRGLVQPANATLRTRQTALESSGISREKRSADSRNGTALGIAAAPPTRQYFFRLTGTNETLKQLVVFTGSFAAPTNSAVLSNSRITGQVSVGGGKAFPFSAQPSQK